MAVRAFSEASGRTASTDDIPFGLSGYVMHLELPQPDIAATLLINEAIVPSARPDVVSVVLDIDVFHPSRFGPDEDEPWSVLEQLHYTFERPAQSQSQSQPEDRTAPS